MITSLLSFESIKISLFNKFNFLIPILITYLINLKFLIINKNEEDLSYLYIICFHYIDIFLSYYTSIAIFLYLTFSLMYFLNNIIAIIKKLRYIVHLKYKLK